MILLQPFEIAFRMDHNRLPSCSYDLGYTPVENSLQKNRIIGFSIIAVVFESPFSREWSCRREMVFQPIQTQQLDIQILLILHIVLINKKNARNLLIKI